MASARARLILQVLVAAAIAVAVYFLVVRFQEDAGGGPGPSGVEETPVDGGNEPGLLTAGAPSATGAEPAPPPGAAVGTGIVHVVVRDADGKPVVDGGRVYLSWRDPDSGGAWDRDGVPSCPSPEGIGRLDDVLLGKELLLRAIGGEAHFSGDAVVLGPTRSGEEVTAEIRLGPLKPVLVGTLVDESGATIARPHLNVAIGVMRVDEGTVAADWRALREKDADPNWHQGHRYAVRMLWQPVDERSRFRTFVRVPPVDAKRQVLLVEFETSGADGRKVMRRGYVLLDENLPGGDEIDLGTIVLRPERGMEPEQVIASGRIVDEDDRPVKQHPSVSVYTVDPDPKSSGWRRVPNARVKIDRDRSFRVLATGEPPASIRLGAYLRGRVRASVDVTPGTKDIVLRLLPGATLHAWFTVPAGVPLDRLVGYIERDGGHGGAPNQARGHFGRRDLRAGRYDVYVKIRSTTWEVARVSDVIVPAGGEVDDARIRGMDLSARVRLLKLKLVTPDGKPPEESWRARLRDADGKGGSVPVDDAGCIATPFPSWIDTFELRCRAGRASVTWQDEEQVITLRPHDPKGR